MTAAVLATSSGHAQSETLRRGGPRDWSHGRLIATDLRPDQGGKIARDWRTYSKHLKLQYARALQDRSNLTLADLFKMYAPSNSKASTPESHLDWNLRTGGFGTSSARQRSTASTSRRQLQRRDLLHRGSGRRGDAVNVIAITNAYAGCPGNAAGATPTVKFGIAHDRRHRDLRGPEPRRHRALRPRDRAPPASFCTRSTSTTSRPIRARTTSGRDSGRTHTLSPRQRDRDQRAALRDHVRGASSNNVGVAVSRLQRATRLFFGDSKRTDPSRRSTRTCATASKDLTNFTSGLRRRAAAVAGLRQQPGDRHELQRPPLPAQHHAGARPTPASPQRRAAPARARDRRRAVGAGRRRHQQRDHRHQQQCRGIRCRRHRHSRPDVRRRGSLRPQAQMLGNGTTTAPVIAVVRQGVLVDQQREHLRVGRAFGEQHDTYLIRLPYNGAFGAPSGYAQLDRSGAGAVSGDEPGHGVPDRQLAREHGFRVRRRRRRNVPIHEPHRRRIRRNRRGAPVTMGELVRGARGGVISADRHRHAHGRVSPERRRPPTSTTARWASPGRRRAPSSSWRSSSKRTASLCGAVQRGV